MLGLHSAGIRGSSLTHLRSKRVVVTPVRRAELEGHAWDVGGSSSTGRISIGHRCLTVRRGNRRPNRRGYVRANVGCWWVW